MQGALYSSELYHQFVSLFFQNGFSVSLVKAGQPLPPQVLVKAVESDHPQMRVLSLSGINFCPD